MSRTLPARQPKYLAGRVFTDREIKSLQGIVYKEEMARSTLKAFWSIFPFILMACTILIYRCANTLNVLNASFV